jgi:hypothetical protein
MVPYASKGKPSWNYRKYTESFIKGRDAINRKDYTTRDAAAVEIRKNL